MSNTIINQYEAKIQELVKENIALFTENLKLKYNNELPVSTPSTKPYTALKHKRLPMSVMKANKAKNMLIVADEYRNNTPVEEIATKIGMSVPTVRAYITELRKTNNSVNLPTSRQRPPMSVMKANKAKNIKIVAEEYKNNTPVEDIAAMIGMSVPTVRAYITELRKTKQIKKRA